MLNQLSSDKDMFNNEAPKYQEALNNNGYKHELKFEKVNLDENNKNKSKKNRKRKREITWYNPPWNEGVKTNIGKKFLKIIENFKSKIMPYPKF